MRMQIKQQRLLKEVAAREGWDVSGGLYGSRLIRGKCYDRLTALRTLGYMAEQEARDALLSKQTGRQSRMSEGIKGFSEMIGFENSLDNLTRKRLSNKSWNKLYEKQGMPKAIRDVQ